ncbi:hypothetical protein [Rubrimonas sp.]|uniref:hypothetical protein n=1 Tax=Rubrimonas sp. TaxID=2036015 RepID=UPI002FDD369B
MRRAALALLSLALPPAGLALARGADRWTLALSGLWIGGLLTCFLLFAGPGAIMALLAALAAAAVVAATPL